MKGFAASMRNVTKNSPIFQYLAMITGTLTVISCGMNSGWPSISLPILLQENSTIPITNQEGSWLAVMPLIGGIAGNYLGGILMDRLGRKNVLLLTTLPSFAGWLMIAYIPSVAVILVARFIAGMSDGASFCILPLYLAEISDPKIRGFLGSSVVASRILGTLLINIIGVYLDMTSTALVCSAIPLLCLLTFWWIPESPYYFLIKENLKQARHSLKVFRGTDDVDEELDRLSQAVREQQENSGRFLDLFTVRSNRMALLIPLVTLGAQQLSGTMAITYYAKTIFEDSGNALSSSAATIIFFSVQLTVCMCCSMIVDRIGRRPMLILSAAGSGLALLIDAVYLFLQEATSIRTNDFDFVPIVALVIYVIIFGLGMQTLPVLMLGEIFPTNVKAFASSLANIYFCVLAALVSKVFQFTKDEFGLYVPFFVFAVVCFVGLLLTVLYVPETKGKTLEDIQEELKGGKETTIVGGELPKKFRNTTEF